MSAVYYRDVEQRSDEWYALRCGVLTASELKAATVGPRGGRAARDELLNRLAAEALLQETEDAYSGGHLQRGRENEEEARRLYALVRDATVEPCGFVMNGRLGCSPDGLVGDDGLVEIKDALPKIQVARLRAGVVPKEFADQVDGQLLVTERSWCDFVSHSRGLPPLIVRVERDEDRIAALAATAGSFVRELDELVAWLEAMR